MRFYSRAVRPALFALDAERAHNVTLAGLSSPLAQGVLRLLTPRHDDARLRQRVFGLDFRNPLGLAAGLDKQGTAMPAWGSLGFGFAEIGTVTPMPQPGNPVPRLFRLPEDQAIINRFGFNSAGATTVAGHLSADAPHAIRIGVNVGRNKATPNERAAEDYLRAVEQLHSCADYFVVNVSSPNTPGLRSLQDAQELRALMEQVVARVRSLGPAGAIPVLVKISPDDAPTTLLDSVGAALEGGAAGIIATNTTVTRTGLKTASPLANEAGGLSGAPLRGAANAACGLLFKQFGNRVPIIGVGGIADAESAYERIRAGATLIQIYTALIYEGPGVIPTILSGLCERLERDGFSNISEVTGVDVR